MLAFLLRAMALLVFLAPVSHAKEQSIYDFTLKALDGKPLPLAQYKGQVILLVNTASECGYTKQFAGLEKLYQETKAKGLVVIGVPSDSFHQELADEVAVGSFCKKNFGVSFPMSKILEVKGKKADPLYQYLVQKAPAQAAGEVQWNFEKFLIDRKGAVVARFPSAVPPESEEIKNTLAKLLAEKA